MAILKRCVHVVITEKLYFVRVPSAEKKDVTVHAILGDNDLLMDRCKPGWPIIVQVPRMAPGKGPPVVCLVDSQNLAWR